ncbi:hypothetical protein ENUP19_0167G0005 [Entamoeba nuttalli]|uniref:Uncharacterized protein n=2 Tax=Entamoeba nuttalli TaxID=412467 RepID=K2HFE4_ENTNP|nr:hypothetical protein ENU1_051710 [Entamoeba nuttalli P19]EKE41554.1 hypothetical protein ENU1_051710 [Entamoeba nuttalli P19]|eukprot:XP_008856109.1 hypothetical protein ENU1_051710 [Entamoeba nuttalli P19]
MSNDEYKLDGSTFLKMVLVIDPIFSKFMEGNYERIMRCKSSIDHMVTLSTAFSQFYRNVSIPYEDRFQLYKHVTLLKTNPQAQLMFQQLDEKTQKFLCMFFGEIKQIQNSIKLNGYNCFSDENLRKEFDRYLLSHSSDLIKDCDINKLIDPFFLDQHQLLVSKKSDLLTKFQSASPKQLYNILILLKDTKISSSDENDFEIDFNTLTNSECDQILKVLTSSN